MIREIVQRHTAIQRHTATQPHSHTATQPQVSVMPYEAVSPTNTETAEILLLVGSADILVCRTTGYIKELVSFN
jgi:hypothetical protein